MLFRGAGPLPRHPSQLYQFALEGVLLFVILWIYSAKPRPRGAVTGAFLLGYGVFRFGVEYFREPDDFLWLAQGLDAQTEHPLAEEVRPPHRSPVPRLCPVDRH